MAVKNLADGFYNDAELLLNEFVLEESCEFKTFATVWRKRNFSFIFMGRESKEMVEFTNEIFYQAFHFLTHDSFWFQIGGVFLLYALYRNQINFPLVRIRVELSKFETMKHLFDKAVADNSHSLHYVLNYLFQNALEFVAFPTLLGPLVSIYDRAFESEIEKKLQPFDFISNLEGLKENRVLEDLHGRFLKYEKLKPFPRSSCTDTRFKKLISILNKFVTDKHPCANNDTNSQTASPNIPSGMQFRNVRRKYPSLDSDLDKMFYVGDFYEIENADESNLNESELVEAYEDAKQTLECDELFDDNVKFCRHLIRRRTIREYYEESPTKADIYAAAMSHVEVLMVTDSEDEFLATDSSPNV